MALRRRSVPLRMPDPASLIEPNAGMVEGRRAVRRIGSLLAAARRAVERDAETYAPASREVADLLLEQIGWWPVDEEEGVQVGHAVALGFGLGAVERNRRWERPEQVDARIHACLATVGLGVPEPFRHLTDLLRFAVELGYWISREGLDDLRALLRQPGWGTLTPRARD